MTTVSTDVQQFGPEDIRHAYNRALSYGTLKIGDGEGRTALFFNNTATIDAAIAHLAEMKTEMIVAQAEPAPAVTERADGLFPCCEHCTPECDGRQDGHEIACTTPGCAASAAPKAAGK